MWLMKAPKNFEKIVILKTQELVFLWGVKTCFGKLPLNWCIFRHDIFYFKPILCPSFWSNQDLDTLSTSKWLFEHEFWEKNHVIGIKWPEMVIKWPFISFNLTGFFLHNWKKHTEKFVFYAVAFDPIKV